MWRCFLILSSYNLKKNEKKILEIITCCNLTLHIPPLFSRVVFSYSQKLIWRRIRDESDKTGICLHLQPNLFHACVYSCCTATQESGCSDYSEFCHGIRNWGDSNDGWIIRLVCGSADYCHIYSVVLTWLPLISNRELNIPIYTKMKHEVILHYSESYCWSMNLNLMWNNHYGFSVAGLTLQSCSGISRQCFECWYLSVFRYPEIWTSSACDHHELSGVPEVLCALQDVISRSKWCLRGL